MIDLKSLNIELSLVKQENYYIVQREEKYFRLGIKEAKVLQDIIEYRDANLVAELNEMTLDDLENFITALENSGIIGNSKKEKKNILFYKIKLFNPDNMLDKIVNNNLKYPILNKTLLTISSLLIISGILIFFLHFQSFSTNVLKDFKVSDYIVFYIISIIVVFLHELGHAISCKYYGGKVQEIGFLLLFFSPALYCDVSGIRSFTEKRKKVITLLAGIFVQLIVFSITSILYVFYYTNSSWLATFAIWNLIMVGSNVVPFIRLDGYWILSSVLDVPNLYKKSLHLALGGSAAILFDEKEKSKKNLIKTYGLLNIGFLFIMIISSFYGVYQLFTTNASDGIFKYLILGFESLVTVLLFVFIMIALYKIRKDNRHNRRVEGAGDL